jgi:spermidine synthase
LSGRARATILGLFFLSGACTLIYQVVWARMLIVVFGVSVYAVSTVLTVFMAGLALGSIYFGRLVDRKGARNGLFLYALLELGIGLFALIFPSIQSGIDELYTALYQMLEGSPLIFLAARFAITFLVLIVPTTLMGATLPVLCKFAVERIDRVGWDIGRLYAVNTLGAAVGSFIAAFVLIEAIGVAATIYAAAAINLLIAAAAWGLARGNSASQLPAPASIDEVVVAPPVALQQPAADSRLRTLVLVAFGISGFVALGYEVVWTRLLSIVLQSATAQTLSTILISFLFGLAAGGAVGARLADRWRDLLLIFAVIELLLGLFGLISVYALGAVPVLWIGAVKTTWLGNVSRLFGAAFLVMSIPTFLMGLLFPVVGRLYVTGLPDLGRRIGNIYGVNTAGAIFGAFAAGFILIPAVGTQGSIDVLAWMNVVLGVGLLLANTTVRARSKAYTIAAFGVVVIVLNALMPGDMVKQLIGWGERPGTVVHFDEDAGGTVSVHDYDGGIRVLKVNGGSEVPTTFASLQTFRLLGTLPLVLHPEPDDVLVIAFGGGITLSSVERQHPRHIDCVEVVPAVVAAAANFAQHNNRIFERFDQPHLNVIIDDGRNHVLRTSERYDVIISDATHPGTADSWVLYTEEFYEQCQSKLQPGGTMAQWLPLHGLTVRDFKMILRTFRQVYPHSTLWLTEVYALMLGTSERMQIDHGQLQRRLRAPGARASLEDVFLGEVPDFLSTLVLDEDGMGQFTGAGLTNTDDRPYISFSDRTRGATNMGVPALDSLLPFLSDSVAPYLTGADEATVARLDRRFAARRHYLHGVVAFLENDKAAASAQLRQALSIDPDEANAARVLRRLRPRTRR